MSDIFLVFIESTISIVGEYKAIILSHTQQLGQGSRATLIFALQLLRENRLWVAPTLLLVMIWITVEFMRKRNQFSSMFKSRHAFTHRELNRDFAVERRLRNGKRWQPSPDRFRRAATVC